jgi:hypothetical protein
VSQPILLTVAGREGTETRELAVERVFNLGFTVRDQERMQRHLDEMKDIKVPRPKRPPIIFPVGTWALTTSDEIPVQFEKTSGEVEFVIIDDGTELLVGVGSDHTDRALEEYNIPWSKQAAPNVLAPVVWRWSEVRDHWDDVTIESWIGDRPGADMALYQRGSAKEFWTPPEMVESVRERLAPVPGTRVFYSGTMSTEEGALNYGRVFRIRLHDPVLGRSIEHQYTVTVLAEEVSE